VCSTLCHYYLLPFVGFCLLDLCFIISSLCLLFCVFAFYFVYFVIFYFFVLFLLSCCLFPIFVRVYRPLPPGGNLIAVNIVSYHIMSYHIYIISYQSYRIIYHIICRSLAGVVCCFRNVVTLLSMSLSIT